ncbi:MAG TPA: class I SAM-dependent methyltransferase, partial [Candidatus Methanoperedens sp.]
MYKFASQFVEGKLVLDVGCGTGYGSNYFMTKGAQYVYAIDNSEEALDYAHKNFPNHRLLYFLMDAQELEFPDETFDIVFSSENIEHLQNPEKNIANIRRVLKKEGILILGTPNKENFEPESDKSSNPHHIKEFFYEELKILLEKYFDSVYIFESSLPNPLKEKRRLT